MNINKTWEKDGFLMRSATKEDAEMYYEQKAIATLISVLSIKK